MISIESLPANPATNSAKVAQATAVSATDGAPMATDAQGGETAAFAAVFQKLSQAVAATFQAPAQPDQEPSTAAPTLPKLAAIPPSAIAKPELPPQLPLTETAPTPDAGPRHVSPSAPGILALDVQSTGEPINESDPEENLQKQSPIKCDSVDLLAPPPSQPIAISMPVPQQQDGESQPVIAQPKRRATLPDNAKEAPETALKQVQPKHESEIQSVQIPQQLTEETALPAKDDPSPPHKSETPRLEFTLPQPHTLQKEIDQPASPPPLPPEQFFIQNNHPKIISAIHGELLPNGGSMHIRLDPPELGALNVQIDVRDGILTASFQTSNDEATRLLSHSLMQLRATLESAGVSVEKLQVQQAPREHFTSNSNDHGRGPRQQAYERSAHDDRQRREMLQRMWRRLTVGRDMLDLVA